MGFCTVLLIYNDYLHEIEKDVKGWWRDVYREIQFRRRDAADFRWGTRVVSVSHASDTQVLALGGGRQMYLGSIEGQKGETPDPVDVLRKIAAQHGYTLTKRRTHGSQKKNERDPVNTEKEESRLWDKL